MHYSLRVDDRLCSEVTGVTCKGLEEACQAFRFQIEASPFQEVLIDPSNSIPPSQSSRPQLV